MPPMAKQPTTIYLLRSLKEWATREAEIRGLSLSAFVSVLLDRERRRGGGDA